MDILEIWSVAIACYRLDCAITFIVGCELHNWTGSCCGCYCSGGDRSDGRSDRVVDGADGSDLDMSAMGLGSDQGVLTVAVAFVHLVVGHGGVMVTFFVSYEVTVDVCFPYLVVVDVDVIVVVVGVQLMGSTIRLLLLLEAP